MKSIQLDLSIFIKLFLGFIFFTIIGTLSHEGGHLIVSKLFGFKGGQIHFGSTNYGHSPASDSLNYYRKRYRNQLKKNIDFPERRLLEKLEKPARLRNSAMTWGGPLQTMLTGTSGLFVLLLINRKERNIQLALSISDWFWVFIALFWLRQVANCIMMFAFLLIRGKYGNGDEIRLANYYNLPPWTLTVITGAIGVGVLYYVIFKFIPPQQRFTFISAGLLGGVAGYVLWLRILGPIILP